MAGYNYFGNPYDMSMYMPRQYPGLQQPQQYQYQNPNNGMVYVHGSEGANAHQLPPGVSKQTLWDDTVNSFYVKGYDSDGIPRILAWNDYGPHVQEEKSSIPKDIDMSQYPTKEDMKEMLASIDTSKFVTKDDLDKIIGELSVGDKGRIVRDNG